MGNLSNNRSSLDYVSVYLRSLTYIAKGIENDISEAQVKLGGFKGH